LQNLDIPIFLLRISFMFYTLEFLHSFDIFIREIPNYFIYNILLFFKLNFKIFVTKYIKYLI
jgi:hypothetical protein